MASDGIEIERKYLLRGLPPAAAAARHVEIEQGYLPGETIRERVRVVRDGMGDRYLRTVKLGQGVSRQEFEEETTREVFAVLWSLTVGRRLRKRRYFVPMDDLTWEIDEFTDRQLYLAELEIPSVAFAVRVPEWLAPHIEREVTEEEAYTNWRLAR